MYLAIFKGVTEGRNATIGVYLEEPRLFLLVFAEFDLFGSVGEAGKKVMLAVES